MGGSITLQTPSLSSCQPTTFEWSGNSPPYTIALLSTSGPLGQYEQTFDHISSGSYTTVPFFPAGSHVSVSIWGGDGNENDFGPFTVGDSGSHGCYNVASTTGSGNNSGSSHQAKLDNANVQTSQCDNFSISWSGGSRPYSVVFISQDSPSLSWQFDAVNANDLTTRMAFAQGTKFQIYIGPTGNEPPVTGVLTVGAGSSSDCLFTNAASTPPSSGSNPPPASGGGGGNTSPGSPNSPPSSSSPPSDNPSNTNPSPSGSSLPPNSSQAVSGSVQPSGQVVNGTAPKSSVTSPLAASLPSGSSGVSSGAGGNAGGNTGGNNSGGDGGSGGGNPIAGGALTSHPNKTGIIAGSIIGVLIFIVILLFGTYMWRRRQRRKQYLASDPWSSDGAAEVARQHSTMEKSGSYLTRSDVVRHSRLLYMASMSSPTTVTAVNGEAPVRHEKAGDENPFASPISPEAPNTLVQLSPVSPSPSRRKQPASTPASATHTNTNTSGPRETVLMDPEEGTVVQRVYHSDGGGITRVEEYPPAYGEVRRPNS